MSVATFIQRSSSGIKEKDERIQRETNTLRVRGWVRLFGLEVKAKGETSGKGLHCRMWGKGRGRGLPLVIPGERWSLPLCRRLLISREPCLTGWGGWPSNMLIMSTRSMLFRAVYKLSTAVKSRHKKTRMRREGFQQLEWSKRDKKEICSKLRSQLLTLGPLALTSGPQVEQCRALLQQGVGILHTDLIDVIYAKLKLTSQLCLRHRRSSKQAKYLEWDSSCCCSCIQTRKRLIFSCSWQRSRK